jgi:pimeloyl-ACP methyl ester carboxylesterase
MKKTLVVIIYFLAVAILSIVIFIIIESPGKTQPFLDAYGKVIPGSIAEIKSVNINGILQKMIIRGRDTSKPVLLYLHGGPGDPEFPFVHYYNPGIEDMFVVCYWEQRGAGLSYSEAIPDGTMTLSQFVNDAGKVSQYLIKKFRREKIFLLGHSWGTMLGAFTVKKFPDYYYSFISVGQVGDQERSEKISYDFVLSRAREQKDTKAINSLVKIGSPPYGDPRQELRKMEIERKYVIDFGGAVKKGSFYPRAIKTLVLCKEYRLIDKINYLKGMEFTKRIMWNTIMKTNLFKAIPSQKIPVYILQGTSDYETSYVVAKEYFESLQAPVKRFFPFENSAHSPIFEEPEKFLSILKEIVSEQKDAK